MKAACSGHQAGQCFSSGAQDFQKNIVLCLQILLFALTVLVAEFTQYISLSSVMLSLL
jgi:enamine deaminase RidA (YjgF/YER057c/UK114 family)